jgi:hypothetical protein
MTDNSARQSRNPNHDFPKWVLVSVGTIAEQSMGYCKIANPCPRNLKSTKVDVTFSTFISSSMETMGSKGRVVPDREFRRLDPLEGMVHEGIWTVDPSFFALSIVHCSMMLGRTKKGNPTKPGA